jgi:hypothetical protein
MCALLNCIAGLFVVPLIVGYTQRLLKTYTVGILLFALLSLLGFDFSYLLSISYHNHILELPSDKTLSVEMPPVNRTRAGDDKYMAIEMDEINHIEFPVDGEEEV